jgi:glutathione reductase (NADPH)
LTEDEIRDRGIDYVKRFQDTSAWLSSTSIGLNQGATKVLADRESHEILGAHILGYHAEEVINIFALAIRSGLRTDDLAGAVWAFPTASSDIASMIP